MAIGQGKHGKKLYISKPLIKELEQFKLCNNIPKNQKALEKIFKLAGLGKR